MHTSGQAPRPQGLALFLPGELRRVACAFGAFFLILCSYIILRPVRDEMAVQYGVDRLSGGDLIRPLPAWAADIECDSWAQMLLKFAISHPSMTCAIPATSKLAHLRDNMKTGRGHMPDEKRRAMIADAVRAS